MTDDEITGDENVKSVRASEPHPKFDRITGQGNLAFRRVQAILIKRFHNFKRNIIMELFAGIILPLSLLILTMLLLNLSPKDALNHPPMLLTPWIYGTERDPNVIFISKDLLTHETQGNKDGVAILESFLKSPGFGVKYEYESTCKKTEEKFPKNPYSGVYSQGNKCYCKQKNGKENNTEYRNDCDKSSYKTKPPEVKTITGDVVIDMSGRNLSEWLLMTERMYRLRRYGGYSLGKLNADAMKADTVKQAQYVFDELQAKHVKVDHDSWRQFFSGLQIRNSVKVWYNIKGLHAVPAYLNTLSNAMLRSMIPDSDRDKYGIITYNHPMKKTKREEKIKEKEGKKTIWLKDIGRVLTVAIVFGAIPAAATVLIIDERNVQSKQLQLVSGVGPATYWISNFVWDMGTYLITAILVLITLIIFDVEGLVGTAEKKSALALLLISYGFGVIPMMYCLSFLFEISSMAYLILSLANTFGGIILAFFLMGVAGVSEWQSAYPIVHGLLHLLPQYCFIRSICDLSFPDMTFNELPIEQRAAARSEVYRVKHMGGKILAMFLCGCFHMGLLILIEFKFCYNKIRKSKRSSEHNNFNEKKVEDNDVAGEKIRVMEGNAQNDPIHWMGSIFATRISGDSGRGRCGRHPTVAVDDLSVGIKTGECFGLLGTNGAGKTTTFNVLIGAMSPDCGDATIMGQSITQDLQSVHKLLGYCPQFAALDKRLTGEEQLFFYARLRGVPEKHIKQVVSWALTHMHLESFEDKQIGTYSGGTKRKLSTAVALIGEPPVILLDEPTAGMDPKAKRFLWDRIDEIVKQGRCVILTSHSMEECETMCNRIGIMVKGRMKCLGTVQHLKSKFGQAYSLSMILQDKGDSNMERAIQLVSQEFPGAIIKERHRGMLQFELPLKGLKLSKIFSVIHAAKEQLPLEDYGVCQGMIHKSRDFFNSYQKHENT